MRLFSYSLEFNLDLGLCQLIRVGGLTRHRPKTCALDAARRLRRIRHRGDHRRRRDTSVARARRSPTLQGRSGTERDGQCSDHHGSSEKKMTHPTPSLKRSTVRGLTPHPTLRSRGFPFPDLARGRNATPWVQNPSGICCAGISFCICGNLGHRLERSAISFGLTHSSSRTFCTPNSNRFQGFRSNA
jgi:hypothetical protein